MQISILLVEDDNDDIELLRDALEQQSLRFSMSVVREGDKVLPFLNSAPVLPDVIVLDFNLPKLHGREILAAIKEDPMLRSIPLMVLTTSASQDDMRYAFAMGATKFVTKPSTVQGFTNTVAAITSLVS